MAKNYYHGIISSDSTDWATGDSSTGNLPCSGESVQNFIKDRFRTLQSGLASKAGYGEFAGSKLNFYDQEGGTLLFDINFSSTITVITITSNLDTTFTVLSSETTKIMTIQASTKESEIGSEEYRPVDEDYTYTVGIDAGNGYVNRITDASLKAGATASFDIRRYLTVGTCRIRVSVTGLTSGTTRTVVYTALVTSLSLTVDHAWNIPWFYNSVYNVNNIRFAGNIEKILHISVDGTERLTETFSASTSYTSTSISRDLSASYFPSTTGVHTIELWMSDADETVETNHYTYNIMCVAQGDEDKELVCINNIAEKAMNFTSGTIFYYATYNATSVSFDISLTDTNIDATVPIISQDVTVDSPQVRYPFNLQLDYDTEAKNGLSLDVTASTADDEESISMPVDNSNAYIAKAGAWFYLKPALRSNSEVNRETIINDVKEDSEAIEFPATWSNFSFSNDGWYKDLNGYIALAVPANSSITSPTLKLIPAIEDFQVYSDGYTLEFMIKGAYPSAYGNPILNIANSSGHGVRVYPTRVTVANSDTSHTVEIRENAITHITITWIRNYDNITDGMHHLCTIYINGVNNGCFQFASGATWGNAPFTIGQTETDTYLYMLRAYKFPLTDEEVKNNYLNAMIDGAEFIRHDVAAKNNIVDGGVSYRYVKDAGFNTMVVEMTSGSLPMVGNASVGLSNVRFEYADHPEWNVYIKDAPIDGQGTTSMLYYRWNLRWKLADNSKWYYGAGNEGEGEPDDLKEGFFDGSTNGVGNHPAVSKIVAKTNYASSMQGHKIGACGMYNDIAEGLGLFNDNSIPSGARAAIYQYPFFGFQYNSLDQSYTFIGLFTTGPDKGDNKTFKFNLKKSTYPSLMSLEGPNHSPLGTRFLTPWTDSNVRYCATGEKPVKEKLLFNGVEGWEVSVAGSYSTDKASDETNIYNLAVNEWKPAYDLVFYCSPYIIPVPQGSSIANINADIDTFRSGTSTIIVNGEQRTISNELVQIYDPTDDYKLYGYANGQYVELSHNLLTYLSLTGSPSQEAIIAARGTYFVEHIEDVFSKDWAVYHWCFCTLFALTDNFAKNSYPVKYKTIQAGGRWAWRQDDMDTIFATDNNGNQTKSPYVEHGDLTGTSEIFQGGESAFWVLVREYLKTDINTMFSRISSQLNAMATSLSIQGGYVWQSAYNVIDHYFWKQSSQYFGINGYNFDREYKYIEPWKINPTAEYNNVKPLTQALGDQYECERDWVTKRLAYIYSKYRLPGMTGDTSGFGDAAFTLAEPYTFNLTPAILYYPVLSLGSTSYPLTPERTTAGTPISIAVPASAGNTTNYIHGLNYLTDLGDLSGMKLGNRGGDSSKGVTITFSSDRLKTLTLGKESGTIVFNAVGLGLSNCYALITLDARRVATLNEELDLRTCPRLRNVYLSGTSIPAVLISNGARVENVTLPASIKRLYLNNLPMLTSLTIDGLTNITSVYLSNLQHYDETSLLFNIMNMIIAKRAQEEQQGTEERQKYYITGRDMDLSSMTDAQLSILNSFSKLVLEDPSLYGKVVYNNASDVYDLAGGDLVLEGEIPTARTTYMDLYDSWGLRVTAYGIQCVDPTMQQLLCERYYTSGITTETYSAERVAELEADGTAYTVSGTTLTVYNDIPLSVIQEVTSFASLRDWDATKKAAVTSFDELQYFSGLTGYAWGSGSAVSGIYRGYFYNFTNMTSVKLPPNITGLGDGVFNGCTSLTSITIPSNITSFRQHVFFGCTGLETVIIEPRTTNITWGGQMFSGCTSLANVYVDDINWWAKQHYSGSSNCYVFWANSLNHHVYVKGIEVTNAVLSGITQIARYAFNKCSNLVSVTLPEGLTFIGQYAFQGTSITSITIPSSVTFIEQYAFANCKATSLIIGDCTFSVGGNALAVGSTLTTIKIGRAHITTNSEMMKNCVNINSLYLSDLACYLGTTVSGNANFLSTTSVPVKVYLNDEELTALNVPSGVTSIPYCSFARCSGLTSVVIPDSVTSIAAYAFSSCSGIQTVSMGNGVKSIAAYGFYGCSSMTSITLSNTLTSIGDDAFMNCSSLTSFTLPDTLTTFGSLVISGCTNLEIINIGNGTTTFQTNNAQNVPSTCILNYPNVESIFKKTWGSSNGNNLSNICINKRVNNQVVTSINIPNTVTSIGNYACCNFRDVVSVSIPNSVTSIGNLAFTNCRNMTSVNIPSSVTTIGDTVFYVCDSLTSVTIENGVTSLGKEVFRQCTSLTSITLPNSVTTIGTEVFRSCTNLTSCIFGSGITSVPNSVFNTSGLKGFAFPDTVTTLGSSIFTSSTSLKSAIIGRGVTTIGTYLFGYCTKFQYLVVLPETYPTLGTGMFTNATGNLQKIYVPLASESAYKGATNWATYSSYIQGATFETSGDNLIVKVSGSTVLTLNRYTGIIVE